MTQSLMKFLYGQQPLKRAFVDLFLLGNFIMLSLGMFMVYMTSYYAADYSHMAILLSVITGLAYWLFASVSTVSCAFHERRIFGNVFIGVCMVGHMLGVSLVLVKHSPGFINYIGLA